ncbi:MAG: MFS transporter [Terriglobia bacterium]
MLAVANMLPSLGKISLGVTAKAIQDEFRFSTSTLGWMLSAFAVGYTLFQVPGGWAGDRYGPRRVLTLAIVAYSLLLAAMAVVPQLSISRWMGLAWAFAVVRFLTGAGEAFTPPNSARVVGSWMTPGKRGLGISFTTVGVGAGGVVTPIFIAWTMQRWGWRTSFWLCGLAGVLVALAWFFYVADRPEKHAGVNAAELAMLRPQKELLAARPARNLGSGPPPWRKMLASGSIWGLLLSYTCRAYTMFFFDTWFFIYLVRVRGLTVIRGGLWGATPYLAILLLSPLGGMFSDFAVSKLGRRRGRQSAVWLGMACSAVLVWIGCHTVNNAIAILLVAGGAGFNMFANVTWWATCIDIAPDYAASLSGLMNMFGGLAGWAAPILTAYIATLYGWTRALDLIAFLSIASGVLWFFVNADAKIDQPPQHA